MAEVLKSQNVGQRKNGRQDAWHTIFEESYWPLVGFIRVQLRHRGNADPDAAQEVAQRVFCLLVPGFRGKNRLADFDPVAAPSDPVLHNLALGMIPAFKRANARRRRRERTFVRQQAPAAGLTEAETEVLTGQLVELCAPREREMLKHLLGRPSALDWEPISDENARQLEHRARARIEAKIMND